MNENGRLQYSDAGEFIGGEVFIFVSVTNPHMKMYKDFFSVAVPKFDFAGNIIPDMDAVVSVECTDDEGKIKRVDAPHPTMFKEIALIDQDERIQFNNSEFYFKLGPKREKIMQMITEILLNYLNEGSATKPILGRIGTHESHCCSDHGCKYGDTDCPVYKKLVFQDFPCEMCDYNYGDDNSDDDDEFYDDFGL